jgi:hypothetical protein
MCQASTASLAPVGAQCSIVQWTVRAMAVRWPRHGE